MLKEEKLRWHDERMTIYRFGRLVERTIREDKEIEDVEIEFRKEYPDAVLDVKLENEEELRLIVEFEGHSSNFKRHGHDESRCDLIICMFHDWKGSTVPVLEVPKGKIFSPHEGIKGSLYDQLKKSKRGD